MIRRHYLVEIKCVKELPLSPLLPPHHGPLPRITSQSDGITVRPWSQREFCNTFPLKADIKRGGRHVRLVPISLQKSPRREARCALAPNTSLNLEGDYADDRQREQRDLTLTSHMRRTAEVAVRRAWPTCAGSERLPPA